MRKLLSVLLVLLFTASVQAADMRELFVSMPDSVLPLLTKNNRLDMLDFIDSNMKATVRNRLDRESELVSIDSNSFSLSYTANSDIEVRLFYYRDSIPVICMIHTVKAPVSDSRIRFFDTGWNAVDGSRLIAEPKLDDFVLKGTGVNRKLTGKFLNASEMRTIKAGFAQNMECIEFCYTGIEFLETDEFAACIRPEPLRYAWNGKRFVPVR